jgi:hypothetical protein
MEAEERSVHDGELLPAAVGELTHRTEQQLVESPPGALAGTNEEAWAA